MKKQMPLVSVSMIAYCAEDFIAEAIEGVLQQKTSFPIELVIGDDCSQDRTYAICEQYAAKYPDIIRLLPQTRNLGIAANTARTMGSCVGKYIAVCDGDDSWIDPLKLEMQLAFLEENPNYGVVYSDVETISDSGKIIEDAEQDAIRKRYKSGAVFLDLLQANFINNSTAVFRRDLLQDHVVWPLRSYQIPDYLRWLHIAARSKVHFMNRKTTAYRRHTNGLSVDVPKHIAQGNRHAFQRSLCRVLPDFHRFNKRALHPSEKNLIFRKMLSLLWSGHSSLHLRWQIFRILPEYFPGLSRFLKLATSKLVAVFPVWRREKLAQNISVYSAHSISKLEGLALILDEQLIIAL